MHADKAHMYTCVYDTEAGTFDTHTVVPLFVYIPTCLFVPYLLYNQPKQ